MLRDQLSQALTIRATDRGGVVGKVDENNGQRSGGQRTPAGPDCAGWSVGVESYVCRAPSVNGPAIL